MTGRSRRQKDKPGEIPSSERDSIPCICGKQLLSPLHKDFRQHVTCKVCRSDFNNHSSCMEYTVQCDLSKFICNLCKHPVCFCSKQHNGKESGCLRVICRGSDGSSPHWSFILPKCIPNGSEASKISLKDQMVWKCWKCFPNLFVVGNVNEKKSTDIAVPIDRNVSFAGDDESSISLPPSILRKDIADMSQPSRLLISIEKAVNHVPEKVPLNFGDGQEIPEKLVSATNDFHRMCNDVEKISKNPELQEVMFDKFKCPFFRVPNKVDSLSYEEVLAHEEFNHQKLFDLFEVMILDHLEDLAFVSVNHENESASEFMQEKLWHCGGTDLLLQLGNDPIFMRDMDRLLDHTQYLNDSIINAICNHANALYLNRLRKESSSAEDHKALPKNIILSTYALEAINIMPESKNTVNFIHDLNKKTLSPKKSNKTDIDPDKFESEVVHWYALQQFGELGRVLVHYAQSNVMPSRILCVFNVKHGCHWTVYDIDMAASCIREYDSMDHHKCTIHAITPWLAKLLGIYRYQIGGQGPIYYGGDDMNLQEQKEPRRNIKNQIENTSFSFQPAKGKFPLQTDGVHCGVFAMYYVLCGLFDVIPNPKVSKQDVQRLRESVGLFFIRSAHLSRKLFSRPETNWIVEHLHIDPEIASQNQSIILKKTFRKRMNSKSAAEALFKKTIDEMGQAVNPIVLPSTPITSSIQQKLSPQPKIAQSSTIVTRKSRTEKIQVQVQPSKSDNESEGRSMRSSNSKKKTIGQGKGKKTKNKLNSYKKLTSEDKAEINETAESLRAKIAKHEGETKSENLSEATTQPLRSDKNSKSDDVAAARKEAEDLLAKIANHVDKTKADIIAERKEEVQLRKLKRKEAQMDGELMWAWEQSTRKLKNNKYLNPADRLCNNKNNLCRRAHKTVVKECCHVIGSRILYPYSRQDTPTLVHSQIKELGCLYKEITLGEDDSDTHCVGSVMVYERHLLYLYRHAVR